MARTGDDSTAAPTETVIFSTRALIRPAAEILTLSVSQTLTCTFPPLVTGFTSAISSLPANCDFGFSSNATGTLSIGFLCASRILVPPGSLKQDSRWQLTIRNRVGDPCSNRLTVRSTASTGNNLRPSVLSALCVECCLPRVVRGQLPTHYRLPTQCTKTISVVHATWFVVFHQKALLVYRSRSCPPPYCTT